MDKNPMLLKGIIFDIQRYSLHDGDGIRTLVFMKGCPLRCLWCSNPESQKQQIEIGSIAGNCIECGNCYRVCDKGAIELPDYIINRNLCDNCCKCIETCNVKSKFQIGSIVTVSELMEVIEKDRVFYKSSGGGITVGGGEPASQYEFVSAFLKECKANNLDTSIETCGYASWDHLRKIIENTDVIHYDIKHMDPIQHSKLTGVDNGIILENAKMSGEYKDIIVRMPVIPGLNDNRENIEATIKFASKLPRLKWMELLPYHTLGEKKYSWIGKQYSMEGCKPYDEEQKEVLKETINKINKDIEIKIL